MMRYLTKWKGYRPLQQYQIDTLEPNEKIFNTKDQLSF